MHAALHSRNAFFTMRSSPEWYEITTKIPSGFKRSRRSGRACVSPVSSWFTAMRTA